MARAPLFEVALAVRLSSVRLLPMVVALLPLISRRDTRERELLLPAHFTAVSVWVEALRLLPTLAARGAHRVLQRAWHRLHGALAGRARLLSRRDAAAAVGRRAAVPHADGVPDVDRAQRRMLIDRLAFGFGLVVGPILACAKIGLDLMWTGLIAGTIAYLVHRLREALR